jgi:hypothetical protein
MMSRTRLVAASIGADCLPEIVMKKQRQNTKTTISLAPMTVDEALAALPRMPPPPPAKTEPKQTKKAEQR